MISQPAQRLCIGTGRIESLSAASSGRDTNPRRHIWAPTQEPCTLFSKAVSDMGADPRTVVIDWLAQHPDPEGFNCILACPGIWCRKIPGISNAPFTQTADGSSGHRDSAYWDRPSCFGKCCRGTYVRLRTSSLRPRAPSRLYDQRNDFNRFVELGGTDSCYSRSVYDVIYLLLTLLSC